MHVLSFAPQPSRGRPRHDGDPVPALIRALEPFELRRAPERTAGDDAIALADRAEPALEAVRAVCELGGWCIGLGIGAVEQPLPGQTRAVRGDAVEASRSALRAARTTSQVPLAIRAADPRQRETAADAEAVLRLTGWMIATRNRGQRRVVEAVREHPHLSQRDLATHLGITQQTVSRAVKTSGWREESAAHPLVARLLAMIDLTSRS